MATNFSHYATSEHPDTVHSHVVQAGVSADLVYSSLAINLATKHVEEIHKLVAMAFPGNPCCVWYGLSNGFLTKL